MRKLLRIFQLIFCLICMILYVVTLFFFPLLYVFAIGIGVCFTYIIATLADLVMICRKKPMTYSLWMYFAVGGFLMFLLCAGMLFGFVYKRNTMNIILRISLIVLSIITAILFLLDLLSICNKRRRVGCYAECASNPSSKETYSVRSGGTRPASSSTSRVTWSSNTTSRSNPSSKKKRSKATHVGSEIMPKQQRKSSEMDDEMELVCSCHSTV